MARTIKTLDWFKANAQIILAAFVTAWLVQSLTHKWTIKYFSGQLAVTPVDLPDKHALAAFGVSVAAGVLALVLIIWISTSLVPRECRRWRSWRARRAQASKPAQSRGPRRYAPAHRAS